MVRTRDESPSAATLGRLPTPCMLWSERRVISNLDAFRNELGATDEDLRYAVKACAVSPLLETLRDEGLSFDCQSALEVTLCLKCRISPHRIAISSPALPSSLISWAMRWGALIIVDSAEQLKRVMDMYNVKHRSHAKFQIGLRLSLNVKATARFHDKLGDTIEKYNIILKGLNGSCRTRIREIHHHGFARLLDGQGVIDAADELATAVDQLYSAAEIPISRVNIGGGTECITMIRENGGSLKGILGTAIDRLRLPTRSGKQLRVIMEPGRALVKDAGYGLCSVLDVKNGRHGPVAVVDLATNVLIPLPLAQFRARPIARETGKTRRYLIGDGTCSPAGVIQVGCRLPKSLKTGQRLIVEFAGAYTWPLAESFYTTIPPGYYLSTTGKLKRFFSEENGLTIACLLNGISRKCRANRLRLP